MSIRCSPSRESEQRVDLLIVTSDRGLCGGYNTNLMRRAQVLLAEHRDQQVRLTLVGRKGFDFFRRRTADIAEQFVNLGAGPDHELAVRLGARVAADFATGKVDAVYLLYNSFRSALSQIPTVEQTAARDRGKGDSRRLGRVPVSNPTSRRFSTGCCASTSPH